MDRWVHLMIVIVWGLNALLGLATVYVLLNWSAFVWILGSAGWAIVCEIFCVLCLVYIGGMGCGVLGWESHMESWYRSTSSKALRCLAFVTPILISILFLSLAVLSLASTPVSNKYVRAHAEEVFRRADTDHDQLLDYYELSQYTLALSQYERHNTSEFREQIALVFDSMDEDSDGYITAAEFEDGVQSAVVPARRTFGISALVCAAVALSYTAIFWLWKNRLKAEQLHNIERDPFFLDS